MTEKMRRPWDPVTGINDRAPRWDYLRIGDARTWRNYDCSWWLLVAIPISLVVLSVIFVLSSL